MKTAWILLERSHGTEGEEGFRIRGVYASRGHACAVLQGLANQTPGMECAWDTPYAVSCRLGGERTDYKVEEHEIVSPVQIGIGDRLDIQGIEWVCTSIKTGFDGEIYHIVNFEDGVLREYEFDGGELGALGAKKVE